jgi:conjugal transfer pilus assembly protein TrbC
VWGSSPSRCLYWSALILVACARAAPGQASAVTDADVEYAKRSQPVITDGDIKRAQDKHRTPTESGLRERGAVSTPNLDRLPPPQTARTIDLEAIARGYQADAAAGRDVRAVTSGPALLVFVSFSNPHPTLERLVDQAARAKASIMLRGFVNGSLQETVLRAQRLIGERDVTVQIDPQAFDRFSIAKTPTFVLLRNGATATPCSAGQCFAADAFVSAAGDVSLDYALEFMQRTAPRFAAEAAQFLGRLRK